MQKAKKKIEFGESRPINSNAQQNVAQQPPVSQQSAPVNFFQNQQGQQNVGNPQQQPQSQYQFQPQYVGNQPLQQNQFPPQPQSQPFSNQINGNRFPTVPPQSEQGNQQQIGIQQQGPVSNMNQVSSFNNNNSNFNNFNPVNYQQNTNINNNNINMPNSQPNVRTGNGFVFQQVGPQGTQLQQQVPQNMPMMPNSQQSQFPPNQQQQQFIPPPAQQNSDSSMVEETRIYNMNDAKLEIKKQDNTELENYELQLQRKNKQEEKAFYKSNFESLGSDTFECKQPAILDYPSIVEKTRLFCQKNQSLAKRLKESMENLLMYDNSSNQGANKFDQCYANFSKQNNIQNNDSNVVNVQAELSRFANQEIPIKLPLDSSLVLEEIQFLSKLKTVSSQLKDVNSKCQESAEIPVSSLSLYSIFLYNFIIKKHVFHIKVEYQDYYFFESQQNNILHENFVALLLYALKCEQRLGFLVYQAENNHIEETVDFQAISSFFSGNVDPTIKMKIQIGNTPDYNKKPIDKYKDLLSHYEKGCKSQIFSFIIDGKWPENQLQKTFDESFNVVSKFQLWLIWMRQMQEKIIDFQLYIRARTKQDSMEQVRKEFSLYFTQILKSFQQEIETSMYLNLAKYLKCIPLSIQSKERAQLKSYVRQIIYQANDSSQVMIGNILCKKTANSCCFYFKDSQDHYLKKVTASVSSANQSGVGGAAGAGAQGYQQKCDSDFQIHYINIEKTYSFILTDKDRLNEKLNQCGKFYDTLLINSLMSKTHKKDSTAITIDLRELLAQ